MSYLERLKRLKEPLIGADKTDKRPFDPFGSTEGDRISEINNHIEAAEERAAIMEYDGGLSRQEAEQYAIEIHLRPFYFKTTDSVYGGVYRSRCTTLEEAIKALKDRFGDKLEEVHSCH